MAAQLCGQYHLDSSGPLLVGLASIEIGEAVRLRPKWCTKCPRHQRQHEQQDRREVPP